MTDKEIYMKDLKRAYDVFQWLQINTDNIKKLYDVMESIDLTKLVTQEQFEELVRETPTLVRLIKNMGLLQLQTEHDTNVLDIDTNFGVVLFNHLFQTKNINNDLDIYYVDYLEIENTNDGATIQIDDCYIVLPKDMTGTNITQFIRENSLQIIGLNGVYHLEGSYYSLNYSKNLQAFISIVNGESYEISQTELDVTGCGLSSLTRVYNIEI